MNKTIYGQEVPVEVGSRIKLEGWDNWGVIEKSEWSEAEFVLKTKKNGYPVNVTVTGSTWQVKKGWDCVRVQVELVRDGEESEVVAGWMCR